MQQYTPGLLDFDVSISPDVVCGGQDMSAYELAVCSQVVNMNIAKGLFGLYYTTYTNMLIVYYQYFMSPPANATMRKAFYSAYVEITTSIVVFFSPRLS